ncbi:MAG TPA: ATP-binding cassette domain-containing protein [Arcobacter sp.]|jgi:iron complex transport system ATP-binding protein|nr:ATP-binding cassette domain-containing protein [Arcobacter sp.]
MLKLDNFSNYILDNLSLEIENKNLIILGSNGSGKTTLAKVLAGLLSDKIIDNKLINYIPTNLDIFDEFMDVDQYLHLSYFNKNINKKEVFELLEISDLENKKVKSLSSGESQLVLFASAILHNAKYTILDEPTANLDPQKIKTIFHLIKNNYILNHKIIITHNLNLAYKLGFDIIYLKNGKIDFNGSSKEFFNQKTLDVYFDTTVQIKDENIVVDL